MRFFKYLVLIFVSIISVNTYADISTDSPVKPNSVIYSDCAAYISQDPSFKTYALVEYVRTEEFSTTVKCHFRWSSSKPATKWNADSHTLYRVASNCPVKNQILVVWLPYQTNHVPIRVCKDGCTAEGSGRRTDMGTVSNTIMQFTGNSEDCTNKYTDDPPPPCDKKDPYGECFVPPDDGCVRAKDGSIHCPNNEPPPKNNNTCNGATYCKRPPEGCGEGYVPGSFNMEQLCVRSGPNKPTDPPKPDNPNDPQNCMNGGSYCPQPPNNMTCPFGYHEVTYNNAKYCVKDNPNPNQPNPNDPNENGGGASEPTDGGTDGGTGGGSINLKPVIDAINALKSSLLSAISNVAGKIDTLIFGQKETNKKLDTSNEQLGKIEEATQSASEALGDIKDATQAASEGIGETNKKLDSVKDSIDSQTKCRDDSTGKYRECTPDDMKKLGDSNATLPTSEIGKQSFLLDLFKVNAANCPADKHLELPTFAGTFSRTYSFQELCDETAWFGYFVLILAYSFAIAIVLRA